jgi:hypothetical protein
MFFRPHRKSLARACGAVATVIVTTILLGAGMPSGSATATTDDRLQRLLEYNPGSVQVGPGTIRTADGIEISLPTLASKANVAKAGPNKGSLTAVAAVERCSAEDLCLFQNQLWEGEKLTIPADCAYRALWTYKLSNGQTWDKHIDSYIHNNANTKTWAIMWRVWGELDITKMDGWDIVEAHRSKGESSPYNAIAGMPWADRIGAARVCAIA